MKAQPCRPSRQPTLLRVWPRLAVLLLCAAALGAPLTAGADPETETIVAPALLEAVQANPSADFDVIVEGETSSDDVAADIESLAPEDTAVSESFETVPAVAATLTGNEILSLADGASSDPLIITRDAPVAAADEPAPPEPTPPQPAGDMPTVTGHAEPGATLRATPPAAPGTPTYAYRWERCSRAGYSEAVLAGAPLEYWSLGERQGNVDHPSPDLGSPPTAFSVEGWVHVDAPQGYRQLISRWRSPALWWWGPNVGGFQVYLDSDGHYGLVAGQQAVRVRTSVSPTGGAWEHVAATWDGSMLRLYRDGVQIGSEPLSGALGEPTPVDLTIADAVDGVAIFSRALLATEVRGHAAGCTSILGADSYSYRVTAQDLGSSLRVVVTTTSGAQSAVSASSLTAPVAARPPSMTSPPSILGTSEEGQSLSAADGTWEGTEPFEYGHQWQRCDVHGESCVDVEGAAAAGYTPVAADVGTKLRLAVTARGLGGEGVAYSQPSDVVGAIPVLSPRYKQQWPYVSGVAALPEQPAPPTIAIVDSGIDAGRADFGGRVIEQVTRTSRAENQPGDGNGHGTAVASIAAGQAEGYTGAAPNAKLVGIDVLDDDGVADVSDVITAADWIYENKERLNIKVANFSLHGTRLASLVSDPLDKAVERLWLTGIVVVTAAGNYAVDGEESAVPFSPGNDPFVITVGATDTKGSYTQRDDIAAPWSAWGYTRDGFAKPEIVAPGRYIAAAVSADTKLARERPERIVEPGYMQLSGTSLAAPVVAGSAANLLAAHPNWTPDQVKGALMLSAEPLPLAKERSVGVGAVNVAAAAQVEDPPNPNLALAPFVVTDPAPAFDSDRWTSTVDADPAWSSVAWGSVAWGSAAWSSVAWGSVAWGSVAWGSVAWGSVAWGSVAWGSVAWGSDAKDDVRHEGGYWIRKN
jgi:serine protease AprX